MSGLLVDRIEVTPGRRRFTAVGTPLGSFAEVHLVDVVVHDREGVRAHGRARCITVEEASDVAAAARDLSSHVVGTRVESLDDWRERWGALETTCPQGPRLAALSGLDLAMWDVLGPRPADVDAIPYTTGLFLQASMGSLTSEARHAIARGFRGVKMLLGAPSVAEDVARVDAVHDAVGDAAVAVEAAGMLDDERADALLEGLPVGTAWIEDPFAIDAWQETRGLQLRSPIPVGGGEGCWSLDGLRRYLDRTGLRHPILDLGRIGGLTPAMTFLRDDAPGYDSVGIHVDPVPALALLAEPPGTTVWLEYLAWWDAAAQADVLLRATDASVGERQGAGHATAATDG